MAGIGEELERLARLLEQGLISREEFDEEKQLLRSGPRTTTGGPPSTSTSGIRRHTAPETGDSIGAYKILGELGEGGMGVVYKARHRMEVKANQQGGDVAVKVLHAQYAQNTEYRARFEREASLGMKLNHPGIIRVFDLIQDSGSLAIAMEMAEGRPMSQMIGHETGPIPWDKAWPLFEQILTAVEYAHSQGVVHRDIKPENVVVGNNASLKILDFGIAKDLEDGKTKTGTGMGTVDYMAPEQYTDASKVDQRADIYALGMTLYEMLAGRLPWDSSTTEFKVLTLKSRGDFPPPTDFYPEIPEVVLRALNGALAVELEDRFTDVGAFRSALEGVALEAPAVVAAQAPKAEAEAASEAASEPEDSSSVWKTVAWVVGVIFFLSLLANKKEVPCDEMAAELEFEDCLNLDTADTEDCIEELEEKYENCFEEWDDAALGAPSAPAAMEMELQLAPLELMEIELEMADDTAIEAERWNKLTPEQKAEELNEALEAIQGHPMAQ